MTLDRRQFLKRAALGTGALAGLDAFAVEPQRLRTTELDFRHLGWGKRLIQFSDVHFCGDRAYLDRVLDAIRRWRADFVFFTGDLINFGGTKYLREALDVCMTVGSPMFGVHGNHDPWDPLSLVELRHSFASTGGRWMLDDAVDCGPFVLHGTSGIRPLARAERKPKLLLCHYPAVGLAAVAKPYDLVLCGHSHGGQVRLPWMKPLYLPDGVGPYVRGLYDTPVGRMFVTTGIGTTGLPVRLLCPPEIVVIHT